ncbi:MAG: conjugal transfer protein TraO [Paludibacteraceae bacterium]|nr:conjugal transfer protein TraO [Paludibacteraceae bacterium]
MKKRLLILFISVAAIMPGQMFAASPLSHIKGMHTIGVRAGTGLGNTFDVGILYQYHFARRWSFATNIDYEQGAFEKSKYFGVKVAPGVLCSVWHPTSWFYLHLLGDVNLGYDNWKNPDINSQSDGFTMGLDLGLNLEFFAIPELSFVLQAQEGWNWGFYNKGGYNYFHPLFSLGIKYNIK